MLVILVASSQRQKESKEKLVQEWKSQKKQESKSVSFVNAKYGTAQCVCVHAYVCVQRR